MKQELETPLNDSLSNKKDILRKVLFIAAVALCLSTLISPPIALLMGLIVAQFIGHPYLQLNHKATHILLQVSVVLLGFGMNVHEAMKVGADGVVFTIASIIITLTLGYVIGKVFKVDRKISYLISVGTAICGGSAIAAISPVIKAEEKQISIALGSVFILNSVALFLFPFIGHHFNLSDTQFGMWCAIAIHDTSSVVGAAAKYSDTALGVATTVKLARALWIIPLAFASTFVFNNKGGKVKIPYFIGYFVLAMIISTYVPFVEEYSHYLTTIAKLGLTLTLFLIGCGLNRDALKAVGFRPFLLAIIIWIFISTTSLWSIMEFVNH